jgi:hypothetical protein
MKNAVFWDMRRGTLRHIPKDGILLVLSSPVQMTEPIASGEVTVCVNVGTAHVYTVGQCQSEGERR